MAKIIGSVSMEIITTWNKKQQKRKAKLEDIQAERMRRERQTKAKAAYRPFNMMLAPQLKAVGF